MRFPRRRYQIGALIGAVGLTAALFAANAIADPATHDALDTKALNQALDALAKESGTSVVAEVRDGDEVWDASRGQRVTGGDDATQPGDHVRIASLTKSEITTVLLQLTGEKKLKLDDPIDKYLPGLLPYKDTITIRELMGHTSGIPDFFVDIYPSLNVGVSHDIRTNRGLEFTPEQIIKTATKRKLNFKPGTDYSYSNTGYFVLGLLVEKLTGHKVQDEVGKRIWDKVGMNHTYWPGKDASIKGKHPHAYFATYDLLDNRVDTTEISPTQFWAAGEIVSNVSDINRFYRAMFDGTLLTKKQMAEAEKLSEQSKGTYGLGLQAVEAKCDNVPGGTAIGHTGGGLGYSTFSFHSPDGKRQATFTYTLDPQMISPFSQKLFDAINDMVMAGLCDDAPSKTTYDNHGKDIKTPQGDLLAFLQR
ncbi:MAG TPA: serine hydrolase domain-containing protein [Stackebrandtia sp.]|jgi:D-alanyl-D-alanine carboxypeptidase|uniref:serine hydrolase domain-containing protein n=1 Tax=Stackebrandtia sp. TaxID=2023065 RepID=UPI002D7598F8|nr:serine hydrolase domain-containing protein [Stackebrandtia sp.]HZE38239.1 serine hydrolase domain-containing protein [Stackebrandtia sp.]